MGSAWTRATLSNIVAPEATESHEALISFPALSSLGPGQAEDRISRQPGCLSGSVKLHWRADCLL